jgi:hypothetical protein
MCIVEQMELFGSTSVGTSGMRSAPTLARSETPGIWKWQFRIGHLVKSGRTLSKASLPAMRRVQLKIDLELKHAGQQLTS